MNPTLLATVVATPAGPLAVVVTPDGVVRAAGFESVDATASRLPAELAPSEPSVVLSRR